MSEKIESGFSPAPNGFVPYDIGFDSQGRIYIANYVNSAGGHKVMRIDNISNSNYDIIVTDTGAGGGLVLALAIDRINSLIYYATSVALYRCNLDGSGEAGLAMDTMGTIQGMDVDENGILYIAGADGTGNPTIFKYDGTVIDFISNAPLNTPWDTIVKGDSLYVANFGAVDPPTNQKIIQFTLDLTPVTELLGGGGDYFYGPHRFVAILNRKIYVVDDGRVDGGTPNIDRIVSIEDINDSAWETYGSTGTGTGEFQFFEQYSC